jgi:hypothetical protein
LTYSHTFEISISLVAIDLTSPCIFFKVLVFLEVGLVQSFFCALLEEVTALYGTDEDHSAVSKYLFNQSIFRFQFNFTSLLSFSSLQL